jgi:predicted amidophosphoribosyltransferase
MTTSPFKRHPRTYCARCEKRMLASRTYEVCWDCRMALKDEDARDNENRRWRGFSADERARHG